MKFGYLLLYVDDVVKSVEFYERAFDLKRRFVAPSEDDAPTDYAEMDTGGTTLGFVSHKLAGSHELGYAKTTPSGQPPAVEVGLVTENVPAAFRRAVDAGCEALSEPAEKPWGQTVSYVRDNNGFLVEICTPVQAP